MVSGAVVHSGVICGSSAKEMAAGVSCGRSVSATTGAGVICEPYAKEMGADVFGGRSMSAPTGTGVICRPPARVIGADDICRYNLTLQYQKIQEGCIPQMNDAAIGMIAASLCLFIQQLQQLREGGEAAAQDAVQVGDGDAVVDDRDAGCLGALHAAVHLLRVQHTAAAVEDERDP